MISGRPYYDSKFNHYKLDDNKLPIYVEDLAEWSDWFTSNNKFVALDLIQYHKFGVEIFIVTYFIGIAQYENEKSGKPFLFESFITDIDNIPLYKPLELYISWEAALTGHHKIKSQLEDLEWVDSKLTKLIELGVQTPVALRSRIIASLKNV